MGERTLFRPDYMSTGRRTSATAYLAAGTGSCLPTRLDSWSFAVSGLDSPRGLQPLVCCSNVASAGTDRSRRTAVVLEEGFVGRVAAAVGGSGCSILVGPRACQIVQWYDSPSAFSE